MNIVVIGTGYVGLVTGACFADLGNQVTCVDIDEKKITNLENGILPIYEPGLDGIVVSNYEAKRLRFTSSLSTAIDGAEVIFIAVGTPPGEDGSADLRHVLGVARELGAHLKSQVVIVDKSTVPVGTADKVRECIGEGLRQRGVAIEFDVVSNPEFLKEGAAVNDFLKPDRVVIGADSQYALDVMQDLYAPFNRNHQRIVAMSVRDAEMTKYVANAMLATKISFMNEMANLCEHLGVDVENVRLGIGSDQRIGFHFIYPGCGYGGSCFPKDVKALVSIATEQGFDAKVLKAVESRNQIQKSVLFEKLDRHFGNDLSGKTIAVWGLAFKPGTDDVREAPSLDFIEAVIAAGGRIRAFDPVAIPNARVALEKLAAEALSFTADPYEALNGADALVLVTEWKQFRNPDFSRMKDLLKQPVVIDGRNIYEPAHMSRLGFAYAGIGRGKVL